MAGCGCNSGNCSDCKKIAAKTANCKDCDPGYTGNILFDGVAFTCDNDETLNIAVDDSLNDIIANLSAKACKASTPVIYSSDNTVMSFPISLVNPTVFGSVTGVSATILADGDYEIHAELNYNHGDDGGLILVCSGIMTLLLNGATISQDGLRKTLKSEIPAASINICSYESSLVHVMSLVAGDIITIGVACVVDDQHYDTLGAQLIVRRIDNFVVQP